MRQITKHGLATSTSELIDWWSHFQVEILVLLGVFLLYLQLVLGRLRRRKNHWFVQYGAWTAYNLSFMLPVYTLGAMQLSSDKRTAYPVWILSLVVFMGGTNSIVVYNLENKQQNMWILPQMLFFGSRSIWIFVKAGLVHQGSLIYWLANGSFIALALTCALAKAATVAFSSSLDHVKVVADYMEQEHMNRYLVDFRLCPSAELENTAVTVEDIRRELPDDDEGQRLNQLCLSFALFRLLTRRYHGLVCAEANLPQARDFVLNELLNEYARGFRVVEVELAFLHDYFFAGYAFLSPEHRSYYFVLYFFKMLVMYIGGPLLAGGVGLQVITDYASDAQRYVGYIVLVFLVVLDVLQLILYCASDWWTVTYVCRRYMNHQVLENDGFRGRLNGVKLHCDQRIAHLNRMALFGEDYWQNKIGQYSLLEDFRRCSWTRSALAALESVATVQSRWFTHDTEEGCSVELPTDIKRRVAEVFRSGIIPGNHEVTSSAAETILKLHIATCLCEIAHELSQEPDQPANSPAGYEIATKLSRYCAYLVAFLPELLPDEENQTKFRFVKVLGAVKQLFDGMATKQQIYNKAEVEANDMLECEQNHTVVKRGLRLGCLWIKQTEDDTEKRWRRIENVWIGVILRLASADNAKHHAQRLAHGGEFVTHLWALLSHAGIIDQRPWTAI